MQLTSLLRKLARRRLSRRGMSLIEIMVVIAIILTLMGVIAIGVMAAFGDAQVQTTTITMAKVSERIEIYMLRKKKPPSTSEGLGELFASDGGAPTDAWGTELVYISPGPGGQPYDLVSYGADKQEGGTGNDADIRWSEQK